MGALSLYALAVICGDLAFWQLGLLRAMFTNCHTGRIDVPDPDHTFIFAIYLLTPLPGLVAVANFVLCTAWRIRR